MYIVHYNWLVAMIYLHSNEMKHMKQFLFNEDSDVSQDLKIQVLGNGSLSTVRICIEKVSGKRFALKARGVLLDLKSGLSEGAF